MKFYYVYVIQSEKVDQWYTGFTGDLRKRFQEHKKRSCFLHEKPRTLETDILRSLFA